MPQLAERMSRAVPSAIMQVAEKAKKLKAQGRDIISFSIGVPNFLPGEHVYAAARESLARDSGQYGSNRGPDALLDAYLLHLKRNGFEGYERRHVCTGVGAKHIIFNAMYAILEEGDEVILPAPYWTSHIDIARILGAEIKVPYCGADQDYKLRPEQLRALIGPKTRLLVFNNPSNPTGMVYTQAEVRALGDVLVEHDLWILSDDIYNQMIFDGLPWAHLLHTHPQLRDRIILLDSLSKTYGMPGWRVGFAAAPEAMAQALVTLNSNAITNLPEVVNAAAVAALTGPQDIPERMCREFAGKRDEVMATFARIPGLSCPRPQGAFYAFPDISFAFGKRHGDTLIGNDVDFCNALLDAEGVACVPGSAFGEPKGLRISYTCKPAELTEGLRRFEAFCKALA
ncbi:MAG: pyridoxal phosphate-dependent aminotransferase [Xanthomonadales bacterium]|nr:Aspartate aminotransferase [Xanthomonadales bacterium]MCC6593729.1 pyridoxal phosphate-dependent aminotransferase [Xanthomonadales bacterium]MCE7932400.1 pyridoxal phosphate-dependent aminotransferase [Xanthomonadales bacterium PRO6]